MSFWNQMEHGMIVPDNGTPGGRFALWWGRQITARRKNVFLGKNCRISPESRVSPRKGTIRIGDDTSLAPYACVQGAVNIGSHVSVQIFTVIVGYPEVPVTIGDNVRIAAHCMMVSANHRFDDRDRLIREQGLVYKPITIEDDVWIASRVNIMAGVTVGKGSVLAAGCVVTKDVEPYSVMAGVPARKIAERGSRTSPDCP